MRYCFYLCILLLFSSSLMSQNKDASFSNRDFCQFFQKNLSILYPQTQLPIVEGWVYDSVYSDEFEGSAFDSIKWLRSDHTYHGNNIHIGYLKENVALSNGQLVFSVRYDSIGTYYYPQGNEGNILFLHYSTGGITSRHGIRYGYYEVECYLPRNHNFRPCFWTIGGDSEYDEVDVFELTNHTNSPYRFLQNEYSNVHDDRYSGTKQMLTMSDSIAGKTSRFGVEVLPYELVFYVNGHVTSRLIYNSAVANSTNAFTCSDITKTVPMEVKLTFTTNVENGIPQPQEDFTVSYFRCYKLDRGTADTYHPITFTPSSESVKVYPHVMLGGDGCTAVVTSPTAVWAEQDIVLDKGFELSAGTAFSARVIQHGDENPAVSPLYIGNCPH